MEGIEESHNALEGPNQSQHAASLYTHYRCDACGVWPLKIERWCCNQCNEFDLCSDCHARQSGPEPRHDPSHKFTSIPIPVPAAILTDGMLQPDKESPPEPPTLRRRQSSLVGPTRKAGAAMQTMNEIFVQAGIGEVPAGASSTTKAQMFLRFYERGAEVFCEEACGELSNLGMDDRALLALEACCLVDVSVRNVSGPRIRGANEQTVKCHLLALLAMILLFDDNEFFAFPVPTSVLNYYDTIKHPSDLSTVRSRLQSGALGRVKNKGRKLAGNGRPSGGAVGEALFWGFAEEVSRIWDNAMLFNPKSHPIARAAARLSEVSRAAVEYVRVAFGFALPLSTGAPSVDKRIASGGNVGTKRRRQGDSNNGSSAAEAESFGAAGESWRKKIQGEVLELRSALAAANLRIDQLASLLAAEHARSAKKLENLSHHR